MTFRPNGQAIAAVRRDKPSVGFTKGLIGTSNPPYTQWNWVELEQYIAAPDLAVTEDGRIILATRIYEGSERRNSLAWVNPSTGKMHEFLVPSSATTEKDGDYAFDAGYAGLYIHGEDLYLSYYRHLVGPTYQADVFAARVALNLG